MQPKMFGNNHVYLEAHIVYLMEYSFLNPVSLCSFAVGMRQHPLKFPKKTFTINKNLMNK